MSALLPLLVPGVGMGAGPAAPPPAPPAAPPPPVPPPPFVPVSFVLIDEDTLEAVKSLWLSAADVAPAVLIDHDTLSALQSLWAANMSLPALFDKPPAWGRLKSPQPQVYAQVSISLARREKSGTSGFWHDVRKVTITVRGGVKAQVIQAAGAVAAVFNSDTTLTYPSGARFLRWWPLGDVKVTQDPQTKDGQDVWQATLEAEVWSVRPH